MITTQGFDALDENNTPTEYKTINVNNNICKTYQFHWLSDNKIIKISKTKNIIFVKRNNSKILEIVKLPTECILNKILEKSTGDDSINGHIGFSHKKIMSLGGKVVWKNKPIMQ